MVTIGIHDGHTATAAIAADGKIVACISEERITRKKEAGGFPINALKQCLELAKINPQDILGVGIVGLGTPTVHQSYNTSSLYKRLFYLSTFILPKSFLRSSKWVRFAQWLSHQVRNKVHHKKYLSELGINADVKYYEHHFLHAATAHLQTPWGKDENLVITNVDQEMQSRPQSA